MFLNILNMYSSVLKRSQTELLVLGAAHLLCSFAQINRKDIYIYMLYLISLYHCTTLAGVTKKQYVIK